MAKWMEAEIVEQLLVPTVLATTLAALPIDYASRRATDLRMAVP